MARKGQITKSVLLSGGMQDDVSEYLQESPSLAYIENGRFRKKDEVEKRLPDTALTTNGLPTTASPLLLSSPKGASLITMDKDGNLYSFDEDESTTTWTTRETNIIPYTNDTAFQSAPEAGMHICQASEAINQSVSVFKMMAWDSKHTSYTDRSETVTVETRKPNGDLMAREEYVNANTPKIRLSDFYDRPTLYFFDKTENKIRWCRQSGTDFATGILGSGYDMGTFLPEANGLITTNPDVPQPTVESFRPGFCYDGSGHAFWDIDFGHSGTGSEENQSGCMVWLDADGYRVRFAKLNTYSTMSTIRTAVVGNVTGTVYTPLACALDDNSDRIAILLSEYDVVNAEGKVRINIYTLSTGALYSSSSFPLNATVVSLGKARAVTGDIMWDNSRNSNEQFVWAVTAVGNEPWVKGASRTSRTTCTYGGIYDTTLGIEVNQSFLNHRLATEMVPSTRDYNASETRRVLYGLEQFNPNMVPVNTSHQSDNEVYRAGEYVSVPTLIRPHTTVIVSVNPSDSNYAVVATLGAGQNKSINASSAEQSPHLNGAYMLNDSSNQPHFCVRNILQPEDLAYTLSQPQDGRSNTTTLNYGEAACRVARLSPATTLKSRVYGEATYFASAVPAMYDGVAFGEASIFDQPEICFVSGPNVSTNLYPENIAYEPTTQPTGVETHPWDVFQVVIGYADHLGQLHRSAPSTPLWVHFGTDASDKDFSQCNIGFTVPLSCYKSQRDYFVEVYHALGEAAPQLAGTMTFNPRTIGTDNHVGFPLHQYSRDGYKDPIRWSETVYTEGNVLPSDPWPAFSDFVITSNRMFAISAELPGTVYYSKLQEENIAPEFSAPLVLTLGRNRNLTAIGKIDDKVLVFTDDNEIFAIYDTGPDNTGANGDFVVDQLQTTVGCSDPESLVEIPDGLVFYSDRSKEFHILSRDLQVHDIGKAIEDTANSITDIRTAIVVPDEHEIRWYVDSASQKEFGESPATAYNGTPARPPRPRYQNTLPTTGAVLVYNYHYKKWCVFSDQNAQHVVLYKNMPTYIETDWDVFQADDTAWAEEQHQLTIRTPWIRLNQLQSFGRLDQCIFLAKYLSDWKDNGNGFESGDVEVTVRYDYEATSDPYDPQDRNVAEVYRFRANAGELGGKGQTEADLFEGGLVPIEFWYGRCQFTVNPGRQKIQAVQFEIQDVATTAINLNEPDDYVLGRGFAITGVDLLYSPKTGTGQKVSPEGTHK